MRERASAGAAKRCAAAARRPRAAGAGRAARGRRAGRRRRARPAARARAARARRGGRRATPRTLRRASSPDAARRGAAGSHCTSASAPPLVEWEAGAIDIAERRAESYPAPGRAARGAPGHDRGGPRAPRLHRQRHRRRARRRAQRASCTRAEHALEDLARRRLRVLHERSFLDDPTRLLRLARYRARLGFEVEAHTAELAAAGARRRRAGDASRARASAPSCAWRSAKRDALAALGALSELGVLAALARRACASTSRSHARALALLPGGRHAADLLLLAVLLLARCARGPGRRTRSRRSFALLDALEFTAGERERGAASGARTLPRSPAELRARRAPRSCATRRRRATLEAVALAGALGADAGGARAAPATARRWLESCATCACRSPARTCSPRASPRARRSAGAWTPRWRASSTASCADGREAELSAALEARA